MSKKIHVGTISGIDIFTRRKNKPNRNDDAVKMGTGIHADERRKKKHRQKDKNELKDWCK